jgi:alcohol dehydrogenase class IV
MKPFDMYFPVRLIMGPGRIKELGKWCSGYGKKAFAVYDPFLKGSRLVEDVKKDLAAHGVGIVEFFDVVPNPRHTMMDQGLKICKDEGCDLVLSIGGGSAIDTAKAIAIAAVHGGSTWEYTERYFEPDKVRRPSSKGLPIITVPTTAGTGTEATHCSVINNHELKMKCTIINEMIYPDVSIIDPELMLSIPKKVTAHTGVDTFAHAFESFISNGATEWSEMLAVKSMELFSRSIRKAVNEPKNIDGRMDMALACTLAGAAFVQSGLALPHAIGQPVSAITDAPHGATLAVCLPVIIEWTIPAAEEKFAKVSEILDPSVRDLPQPVKAKKLPEILAKLYKDIDIDETYASYGMTKDHIEEAVNLALGAYQWDIGGHPKKVERSDLEEIYRRCL